MDKPKLIIFADGSMGIRAAGHRLANQGKESGLFQNTHSLWDIDRLHNEFPDFTQRNHSILKRNIQGYGFWIWKPAVIHTVLAKMPENEIVLFLDAGCQLNINVNSMWRFVDYCNLVEEHEAVFMELKSGEFHFENVTEVAWSKNKTRTVIDPANQFAHTNQYQSGIIFLKNTERVRAFVLEWLEKCEQDHYSLLLNPRSDENQEMGFIAHRWEQSISSLLAKKYGFQAIPDETYWYPDWAKGSNFPIWAMRNRSGGDAYRRNPWDLVQIAAARIERNFYSSLYRRLGKRSF